VDYTFCMRRTVVFLAFALLVSTAVSAYQSAIQADPANAKARAALDRLAGW
jgi:hypothetical protein